MESMEFLIKIARHGANRAHTIIMCMVFDTLTIIDSNNSLNGLQESFDVNCQEQCATAEEGACLLERVRGWLKAVHLPEVGVCSL